MTTNRSLTVAALYVTALANRAATVRERLVVIPYRNSKQEYASPYRKLSTTADRSCSPSPFSTAPRNNPSAACAVSIGSP